MILEINSLPPPKMTEGGAARFIFLFWPYTNTIRVDRVSQFRL